MPSTHEAETSQAETRAARVAATERVARQGVRADRWTPRT
jgi:hypothetical protein